MSRKTPSKPRSTFYCRICDRRIRLPKGWGVGAAVRKHYWRRHPEVMSKTADR